MDIAANRHWGVNDLDIGFFDKELARFVAELTDSGFGDGFAAAEERDVAVHRKDVSPS